MTTSNIARFKKSRNALPGRRAQRMRKYAIIALCVLIACCSVGIGLMMGEYSTPGMAWYTYE